MDTLCDAAKVPAFTGLSLFLICPVRNVDPELKTAIEGWVEDQRAKGYKVYYPAQDTNQEDPTGFNICQANRAAIQMADIVCVAWDGKSQGSLFDLGMAFMADKLIQVIYLPSLSEGKSFQNMITEWEQQQNKLQPN